MNQPPRLKPGARTTAHRDAGTAENSGEAASGTRNQDAPETSRATEHHSPTTAETEPKPQPPRRPRPQSVADLKRLAFRAEHHRKLDAAIRQALAELELLPGNIPGRGIEAASRDSERNLPVDAFGRARGDLETADLKRRAERARTIEAKSRVLEAIRAELAAIRQPRRVGWADRQTEEGRLMIARHARDHGRAATAYAFDISTRTVTKYLAELREKEGNR